MSRSLAVYSSDTPRGAPRKARGLLTLVLVGLSHLFLFLFETDSDVD
jgi:hypothetical protein